MLRPTRQHVAQPILIAAARNEFPQRCCRKHSEISDHEQIRQGLARAEVGIEDGWDADLARPPEDDARGLEPSEIGEDGRRAGNALQRQPARDSTE